MTSRTLDGGTSARPAPDRGPGDPPEVPVAVPAWPQRMDNPVRGYDWGSRHVLATLQGRPAPGHPEAELWMGAHPGAPSVLPDAAGAPALDALVVAAPDAILGRDCHRRFGPRLPFLLKVLAVDRALSVQVHPDPAQAARGHAREEAAGVPLGDPTRVYPDPHAKPEMLYAVTAFEALAGLRPVAGARALTASLGAGPSHHRTATVAALLDGAPDVTAALAGLVRWPADDRRGLVEEVAGLAARALARTDPVVPDGDLRAALGWVAELAVQHPADPLVLGPLLMQLHRMAPGGTLYLPAGVPHAYLTGVGVEVLAASDNVVRAGLTNKHVDAAALLDLLDPAAHPVTEVPTAALGPGETAFRPPVEDFQLTRVQVRGSVRAADLAGPQVLLCLSGAVAVGAGGGAVELTPGRSAFVGAGAGPLTLTGDGLVFRAAVGRP